MPSRILACFTGVWLVVVLFLCSAFTTGYTTCLLKSVVINMLSDCLYKLFILTFRVRVSLFVTRPFEAL